MSKSKAAIERAYEADSKKKSKSYGRYFIAEPRLMEGDEMPTRDEWIAEQENKKGAVQERRPAREPHIVQGKK